MRLTTQQKQDPKQGNHHPYADQEPKHAFQLFCTTVPATWVRHSIPAVLSQFDEQIISRPFLSLSAGRDADWTAEPLGTPYTT